MAEGPGVSSAPTLPDRASALKVFGWGEIVLGVLCVLFAALILLAVRFQTPTGTNLLPSLLIYPLFGAAFVTLGIGSIRARRWSRALLLIWGWLWLVGGALGLLTVTLTTPRILRETVPAWQALPLFGYLIRGWPAILIGVVFGILGAALALAIFRRNPIGWLGLVVLQFISLVNLLTLRSLDPSELLSAMGYSSKEVAAASRFNMWADPAMQGMMVLGWISTLVFLFWTRKFYRFGEQSPSDAPH